ncbi:ABC transporter ATP-binding protein [Paenibacillus graminis]|uniref:Carnitine transport ATP-binding protein OpuCA n=1 Tax=Paenibacillus graminis TaxID=189425 RepID=A0A089NC63_9BACL|nr:ABC transporter ATP-binding protein [Paenibacillus graminis]AIQ66504.1 ABC transporter [Paenibacillus graminis]
MEAHLSIQKLTKRYKTGDGVTGISLDVKKGEMITLLGPSGCGKTTVLRSVGGFLDPDSGDIMIEGKSVLSTPPEKRPTSMVFQGYNLWPHMTVYENLAFGLKIRKIRKAERDKAISEVLELVRLPGSEKKYPGQLSGGQQQRIAVARSLLLKPAVLLLDEPFSALDAKLRHEMREELREIQAELGLTMVFVTHDQEEALSISDRIVVMNHGQIEQIATPQEIYDEPKSLYVAQFIGKMNFMKGVITEDGIQVGSLHFPNATGLSGEVTVAVRPEDIVLESSAGSGLHGIIKQIMVLGHYAEVSADIRNYGVIRAFMARDKVKELQQGQEISVQFSKILAYPQG